MLNKKKMKKNYILKNGFFTLFVLAAAFLLGLMIHAWELSETVYPMIFVLGTFLVSIRTEGYLWGILTSLISALLVNFAFTKPYYGFDLLTSECFLVALIMIAVSVMTSALTKKIKEQEKIKAESEKEKMQANLLRAVSHDLRTPLTTIYGSCSTIIENYDSLSKEHQIELLNKTREDSEWLIRMVENLLSVTRIDNDKVSVAKMPTVPEELIDAVLVKFYKRYPEQKVQVKIPDEFISIPMDAMLIEQVLINLLENAVVHAKGMTKLALDVGVSGSRVVFSVFDDGCGIPKEHLDKIFNGFQDRINGPSDGNRHNMGIGLSVCSTIIKAHGGEIQAMNRPEKGAVFWFTLEREMSDD